MLAVTRIFPNRAEPHACAFQRQQLAALAKLCPVEVWATIPYLPGASLLGDRSRARRLARVPSRDTIDGLSVVHPRTPYLPGAQRLPALAPANAPLYLAGLLPHARGLRERFDVVLGSFLYPDACAAAMLARILDLPYVIKTHGTDVNVVAQWPSVQPMIVRALRSAAWVLGVSRPIVDELIRLGAAEERTALLPNGVDRAVFRPMDRAFARHALGLPGDGKIIAFVGGLEREKGLRELAQAYESVRAIPTSAGPVHLVCVGEGALRPELEEVAARLARGPDAARGRIILAGEHALPSVARYLGASDLLALPSWAEGTPNVVLEALAAGRPVVASRVGGIPDAIAADRAGILVPPRDAAALAAALGEALARPWDEAAIVASAPPPWSESADLLHRILTSATQKEAA